MSFVLTGLVIPLLDRARFMDVPNHRSSHTRPVPRGGGIAVIITIAAVALLLGDVTADLLIVILTMIGMAAVGLADDISSVGSGPRLVLQLAAGVAIAGWAVREGAALWWLPILAFAVAGYVNAFNFMDGVNGISALTTAVVGGWWWYVGAAEGVAAVETLGVIVLGAALGFLPWNSPRARVFLGDVGSYGLGLLLAAISILAWTEGVHWLAAGAPLIIYCADTGWVLIKRLLGGRPLAEAHREHVYQRLTDRGWPHWGSAVLCAGAGATVCGAAVLALNDMVLEALALMVFVAVFYLCAPSVDKLVRSAT